MIYPEHNLRPWERCQHFDSDSRSSSSTSTVNETHNTSISDSYNTSNYDVTSLSDIGSVSLSGINTDRFPVLMIMVLGIVFVLVVFIKRKG